MSIIKSSIICFYLSILYLFLGCNLKNTDNNKTVFYKPDSISIWIKQSKDKTLGLENRKKYLLNSYDYNNKEVNDSIKNRNFLKIAFEAYKLNDTSLFKKANRKASNLSLKIKDTFGIADSHWNYAAFYIDKEVLDSAYFHYYEANENFKKIEHDYYSGKMLFNMAIIQKDIKDYTGSEILIFQAIPKFKSSKRDINIYRCYNLLGIVNNELDNYDKAIYYHNIALGYLNKTDKRNVYKEMSLNNISLVYQKQGKHKEAIKNLNKALKNDSLKFKNINLYAKLIDNKAYNKFLNGDTVNLPLEFYRSLKIRDSLHYISGIVISKLHLGEFYAKYNDTLKAITNITEASKLAKSVNNNRDKLAALKLLSKIDKTNANRYLKKHIALNDSLQSEERKIRNKFTRIQYETDEYIQETQQLSKQKRWITIIGFFIIAIISLLYYIKRQQSKNKELLLEKEQQKANEEIYELILDQNNKMKEGRTQERHRISEELHDGVLGKLFGTRMGLGFLNFNGKDKKKYDSYIDEMQGIENDIRIISHELKNETLTHEYDFISLLESLLEKQSEISKFEFKLISKDSVIWDEINNHFKINIYRILQEAIHNINKYAKASLVEITFLINNDKLNLVIKDDGVGFEINKIYSGIGLNNMKSRVNKFNGNLQIDSIKNKGTNISIEVELKEIRKHENI